VTIANRLAGHARIGIDSTVVIYALEGSSAEADAASAAFDHMAGGQTHGILSILGLIEVLVAPARHEGDALAQRYADELADLEGLTIAPIDRDVAIEAAHIRASGARLADAIHLGTARSAGASAFLTNDPGIRPPPGLEVILLTELLP
jgi:predicted nucleic acid-binding protein